MRKMLMGLIIVGLGCFAILFGLVKASDHKAQNPAPARHGVLDLSAWNFQGEQVVSLDGQWEFYWDQLLRPGGTPSVSPGYMQVPGFWKHANEDGGLNSQGAVTYRLKVKLEPSATMYGLRISNIRMASEIYVNGDRVAGSGKPAEFESLYRYENKPYNAFFTVQGDTAEIIIHAANYENSQGGIPYSLYFGSAGGILKLNTHTTILNLILIVSLLMLGCYQLSVFIIRREERGLLYFGLSCIIIAWSFASNGDRILVEYVNLPHEIYYKIQAVSLYLSLITMVMFIKTMCKSMIPEWLINSVVGVTALYIGFVLLTPFQWYSRFNAVFSYLQLFIYVIILGLMLHSYLKGRYGEFSKRTLLLFILALGGYVIGLFDYGLYLSSLTPTYTIGYCSILIFCFLASFLLSYRYSEAYKTIEGMAVMLQQADKQKDEFLLHTSHEFQTPLHGIINLSQSMLETGAGAEAEAGELSASHIQNLSLIRDTSRRLSGLVHDILDMEKIKRNELKVQLTGVDVRVSVSLVFDLFQGLITGKKIRFVNAVPEHLPLVYADENRLRQILHNLVGNAVKFTHEGMITIHAQVIEGQVKVVVEDTGVGMSLSDWEAIFQPFEQAHSPEEYGGTGLGLFICRKLLHLMDGTIKVEWSEPEQGTGIAFTLPVAEAARNSLPDYEAAKESASISEEWGMAELPGRSKSTFTLLAVDDEPSNLQVLSRVFANEPYQVIWATNGLEALEMLKKRSDIDLVLLDVMMPKMSGVEVCREIRGQYSLFELPVVLLTARYGNSDIAAGFKAGANDYIIKPFDAAEVRARTETLLKLKKSVEEALKAEVDFLQSQIKPHFLFNSLNSIIALCRTDGARAEKLIMHLSYYLRRSFDPKPDSFVRIEDELQLVDAYVQIEEARFEERLTVVYDVDPQVLKRKILPLTIQPLVENAIRHGVTKKMEGGTVRISISLDKDTVYVEVWDNGGGISETGIQALWTSERASSERRGVGLVNIQRRLKHFYGEALQVSSEEGEWTSVRFQFKIQHYA
ncbi:histidine kinase [Paenibacillus sp. FSL P4-0081]|uniref:ATP-binding protein n=1 Tax=Paenibacillus sp. FSL P4-0081 TaxID=1536769 RepID=UPI0004F7EBC7|nr:ATP-binding protein [Paenibacillus sp. FSL P4-0081]AIQ28212.1 histidine kinase [Paenibacillus sp. FSL P4-0081]